MLTQRACNSAWLSYARGVLGSHPLRRCCQFPAALGEALHDRILWPGYIGSNYAKGRVFFVGAMHNAGELFTPEITALAGEAARWAASPQSSGADERYLRMVQDAYLASIPRWTKGAVWGRFDRVRTSLNLTWRDIAFTNVAKCAEISASNDGDSKKRYTKRITRAPRVGIN